MRTQEEIRALIEQVKSYPEREKERIYRKFFSVPNDATRFLCQYYGLDTKRVIDTTCHYGYYLAHFGEGSVGLDASWEYMRFAQEMGLTVQECNLEEQLPDLEPFDALLFSGTLEEILSPHVALMRFRNLIKPDGLLCLRVPVVPPRWFDLLYYRARRRQPGYDARAHLYFFTPRTLSLTVQRAGYDILQIVSPGIWMRPWLRPAHTLLLPYVPTAMVVARLRRDFKYPDARVLRFLPGWANDLAPYHQDYQP